MASSASNDTRGHGAGECVPSPATPPAPWGRACARMTCLRAGAVMNSLAVLIGGQQTGPTPETLAVRLARAIETALPSGQSVHLSLGLATGVAADFTRLLKEADDHLRLNKDGMGAAPSLAS